MSPSTFTLYLVGGFFILNLIIGLWFGRKVTDIKDYSIANKSYGTGPLVMTYLATYVGGGWISNHARDTFHYGFGPFLTILGASIGMFIRAKFVIPKMFRFRNCISLADIVGQLYGRDSKFFSGILSTIFSCLIVGVNLAFLGGICEKFLNVNSATGIVISSIVLGIYTSLGGIRAVVATDIIQFTLCAGMLLVISSFGIQEVGGLEAFLSKVPFSELTLSKNTDYYYYCISTVLISILFSSQLTDTACLDRILIAKSPYHASRMQRLCGGLLIILTGFLVIVSLSALVLYPDIDTSNLVYHLSERLLPFWAQRLTIVALLAIAFSTGDSYLHSAGVSLSHNVLSPILKVSEGSANKLRLAKVSTFLVSIFAIWFAIWGKNLFRLGYAMSITASTLAAPLLYSIAFGIKPDRKAFWGSAVAAVATLIVCKTLDPTLYPAMSGMAVFFFLLCECCDLLSGTCISE